MSTPKPGVPMEPEPLPDREDAPAVGSGAVRDPVTATRVSWILGGALLVALAAVVGQILAHFATALAWAVILAVSLWPVHRRIRARLDDRPRTAASLTMLLVTLGVVVPVTVITVLLVREIETLSHDVRGDVRQQVDDLERAVTHLPYVGERLHEAIVVLREDSSAVLKAVAGDHVARVLSVAGQTAGAVTRTLFNLVVCLFTAFFLFLHGDSLAAQLRGAGTRVGGPRLETIVQHVGITVRAVVYGLVLTAAVQGVLAALGFWVAGVPFPILLGALTMVLSFVPMGHAVVWVPAAAWLVLGAKYWAAAGLVLWGAGVVASIDNVIRPVFIGVRTGIPLLLVFIGVLGGILSFGLVGIFVGPVAIAVALALWWEWMGTPPA
ncbi:MAG: AI-2E family transporter [Deltaproteobacteria bacterium]|nr:AI-2E family transporter [Deltaproteobacteria bacterium]